MSTPGNDNREPKKSFFELSSSSNASSSSIIIALILLVACSGFLLINPTPMNAALAQENNTTTTITINGDADSDTDGSIDAADGGENGNASISTNPASSASSSSSGIELSPRPIFQDQVRGVSETPINQTYMQSTVSGNGTMTLPNTTETINTTSSGSLMVSMKGIAAAAAGKEILTTEGDKSDNATATVYEIARFNTQEGTGKGIIVAIVHTNSTGKLAPLDGMILAGQEDFYPDGSRLVTMWEWESGIPLIKMPSDLTQESQADTATTTTNTTTTISSEPSSTIMS
jgi:hypothetical protein